MPRVNRDLQRRLAARRERERRRPVERRYRFGTTEPDLAPEERVLEEEVEESEAAASAPASPPVRRPAPRDGAAQRTPVAPFSAYKTEYAYVLNDLRRIVLVVGSLLAVLIVLYFVLPR